MIPVLLLIACMVLLVLTLGLPLLFGPDSAIPDIIGFSVLTVIIAAAIWATGDWWILLPVLALLAWLVWLDKEGRATPVDRAPVNRAGMSARTRLRFRLWWVANNAILALGASLFILPAGSAAGIVLPGIVIALAASHLFRFSFCRSAWRDGEALYEHAATASPAPFG